MQKNQRDINTTTNLVFSDIRLKSLKTESHLIKDEIADTKTDEFKKLSRSVTQS